MSAVGVYVLEITVPVDVVAQPPKIKPPRANPVVPGNVIEPPLAP